ncbi:MULTISPECIES: AzlC family ABC transporter permease [Micromonospora]|uniref:Branched-chain amino acid ABC transporter permease n=1 Tax=Micromonospora solifontis TaxID=2487138 RepID=A0ABX9WB32_9ACTN|nr:MULTISPECIES: AzlC family ABC transporter permease [Micromonospora]NES12367.1 branched-chain amino acid ABC transporter permease [Micromonospora sp. PPF5-17B]NES38732.1 branched-chain amino acid ABC transporter permease [Micromonospora solifontis]NES54150.1 branched-chain amino acid ABC transporter permease [Micromonospora sp. PPF5-6]RNL93566.1 branched-chain amino acid ABC transporter permease [Micromonospora solifontis]
MRTADRTGNAAVLRDVAAIGAAMAAVGASFGAVAVAAGLPGWATLAMSVLVYAGGAQFMAVGLVAAGSPLAAVLAGLLLNARHLPFGLALGGSLGPGRGRRLLGSHLMTDEATAFALARPAGPERRRAFWLAGILLFLSWNAGTALGVLAGGAVGDPAALGLDAAFPAGLAALLLPSLRDRNIRRVALAGAGLAVLATPLLPAGLPVLLALAALIGPAVRNRSAGVAPPSPPAAPSSAVLAGGAAPSVDPGPLRAPADSAAASARGGAARHGEASC